MDDLPHRVILSLVHELHRLGYQRLRIAPGMAPSGVYWRCTLAAASHFSAANGACIVGGGAPAACYSSGQERIYFGWEDAAAAGPQKLATMFVARFPEVCAESWGADWAYDAWYRELLRLTAPAGMPIAYADWPLAPDVLSVVGESASATIVLPPPGEHAA